MATEYYYQERKELTRYIPSGIKTTLDVGCASGYFSKQLKRMSVTETWGIEAVKEYAELARTNIDTVLSGLFDEVYDKLPKDYFDCIFFNDVLEHMIDPDDCLRKVKANLQAGKYVLASIPNVRHVSVLRQLLFAKDWRYEQSGIMDKTHLRFFTRKSIIRMFDECGYKIIAIEGINKIGRFSLTSILNTILLGALNDVRYQQFVVLATPKQE